MRPPHQPVPLLISPWSVRPRGISCNGLASSLLYGQRIKMVMPGLATVAGALPTPDDLLRDLLEPPACQQYDGKQVAFDVFRAWRDTMSWSPIARGTDVSVRDVQPQPVADELA